MVTRQSLTGLVAKLTGQLATSETCYRDEVVAVVLAAVRADSFSHVPSFRWLVTTLFGLAALESKHGADVAQLLVEVTLRVQSVRAFAAERALEALRPMAGAMAGATPDAAVQADAALIAAAWVLGEHSSCLPLPAQHGTLEALLSAGVATSAAPIQASCVQAALRVLVQVSAAECR